MGNYPTTTIQATSTASFIDSIGVNTHIDSGRSNYTDAAALLKDLSYLGVHNVRDGTPFSWLLSTYVVLAQAGIKFDLEIANQFLSSAAGQIDVNADVLNASALQSAVPGSVLSIEGANEYNINHYYFNGQDSYNNIGWSSAVDAALGSAVHANAALAGVHVVASATPGVWSFEGILPNESAFVDTSNAHVYAGVGQQLQDGIAAGISQAQTSDPGGPVYVTETGISSSGYGSSFWGVTTEHTQAIIDINALLDGYKDGASKTFLYELLDETSLGSQENNFGLFNVDGTPKPVAIGIHNLTSILADSGNGATPPGALSYQIVGLPSTASSMLLEKSDGTFEIVIWNGNATVSNGTADVTPASAALTINFGASHQHINLYDPIQSAGILQSYTNAGSVSFSLGADPIIIEIPPDQGVSASTPIISPLAADSNVVGDGITNVNQLTLTGTALVGDTVTVFDGANQIGTASVNGSGVWSFATATLADGSHAFSVKATDGAGNVSGASTTLHVTVDTAAPGTPSVTSFSPDSNIVGDGVTNANHITLTGTAEAGSSVKVFDYSTQIGTVTANASGTWSFATLTLTDSTHVFSAQAMDAAGNVSAASTKLNVTIDTVAPLATVASFSPDSNIIGDGVTNANHLTLTGVAAPGTFAKVFDGATQIGTAWADSSSGAWSFSTVTLADGTHAFTVQTTDAAGNTSTSAALNVTVDTVAPGAPTVASFSSSDVNHVTLTGTAAAGSTVEVFDGATQIGTAIANGSGAWSFATAALANGNHPFTGKAMDAAGNVSVASAALNVAINSPNAATVTSFSPDSNVVGDGVTNANHITLTGTSAAGGTVQVFDGASQIGTATANSSGVWSFATATLADGSHAFTSKAVDAFGNAGTASVALNVTVDTAVPNAPTLASFSPDSAVVGDGITNANHLTLTGTAGAGSTVLVFDGTTQVGTAVANGSGAWSFATATLADGGHAFTVKAMDSAGNVSPASAALNVTVDTIAPGTPSVTSFSPDSNIVGDGVTNANHITLTGTAEAGSTVKVFDYSTQIGTVTVGNNGTWTFATATLTNSTHAFSAQATDAAGNLSAGSTRMNVTVDTVAPTVTIKSFSPDSNIVGDGITNVNHLTLTGTGEAGRFVQILDGATQLGSAWVDNTGAWSFATATLADGSHAFTVKETDAAGNIGTSAALNVTVDTVAPGAPTVASFSSSDVNHVTLTGTAAAGSTVEVFDGATQIGTAIANGSGAWSFATATLANGNHSFTGKAMDAAGNVSVASAALNVAINSPNAATVTSFSPDSNVVGDGVTNANHITLTGTSAAGGTVQVFDGATQIGTATANSSGVWSFATATLADGSHAFTSKAVDAFGNAGTASVALNVTVDTAVPNAPTLASFSPDSAVVGDGITNANHLTLTGTAGTGSTVLVFDGTTQVGTAVANGSGAWSFATATLADGGHAFTVKAMDSAGNVSPASAALNVTVDTTAPSAPVVASFSPDSNVIGDGVTNANHVTLTGTAEAGSTVKVFDYATQVGTVTANSSGVWTFATATLTDSTHVFTAQAMDAAGNVSAGSARLNVTVDTVAPMVTVASFSPDSNVVGDGITNVNHLTLTGTGEAGRFVQILDGATQLGSAWVDNTGAWSFATATLADGSHAFTVKETDAAGNIGTSASLNVTVDTVAPNAPIIVADVAASSNSFAVSGTAEAGSTVKLFEGATLLGTGAADASGHWNINSGSLSAGSHDFTATATDSAGNVSTTSNVLDPVIGTAAANGSPLVSVADFNGDKHGDILWQNDNGTVSVWDSGQISAAHWISNPGAVPSSSHIAGTGDFDGNGQGDILWRNDNGAVFVWDNGNPAAAHTLAAAGVVSSSWHIVGTGDFDGNGHDDILWQNDNGAVSIWDNGQISGAHIIANAGAVSSSWHVAATGDFDGNGHADILWQNTNGAVSIWDNGQISGAHLVSNPGTVSSSWHIVGAGDFDGNGHDDILWQNDNGAVSIWDNGQITGAHLVANPGTVSATSHVVGIGDFDHNGRADILWHDDNGAVSIWDNGQPNGAHTVVAAHALDSAWHIV